MSKVFKREDIDIDDGWVSVKGVGRVGLWWQFADQKVCLSYGFGESFFAKTYTEVEDGILKILNPTTTPINSTSANTENI